MPRSGRPITQAYGPISKLLTLVRADALKRATQHDVSQQKDMSRKAKTVRPYRMHLNRVRNARSILLGAFLLMALALVTLLTSPVGVALALSLGPTRSR
jgi:hypothetical protein